MNSDERREVAENLRNLTISHNIRYKEQFFDELAEVVVGFEDFHDFDVVIEKLADLIDPTCEVRDDNPWASDFDYVCCACGEHFSTCDKPNYCPGCGCRFVYDEVES